MHPITTNTALKEETYAHDSRISPHNHPAKPIPRFNARHLRRQQPQQALFKILADIKWWLPVVSTLISISLLTKYLWVIHHPELILSSLGNPSNLVAWLFFSLLILASLLLIVSVPSVVFTLSMSICTVDRELEKRLAFRFGLIVGGGYLLLSLNLLGPCLITQWPQATSSLSS
ncbi:hypothetical protein DZC31_24425 [Stenotrophomonas rhizophila]|nr:hypothetical protein DZC31_24425 [Stenotrophomonas rhizophila]